MKLNYRRILVLLLTLTALFSLAACGNDTAAPEESAPAAAAPQETPEPLALIGREAEGDYVYSLKLTNRTGADITAVSVKADADEAYPENMLPAGETFAAGEARMLWFDAAAAMEAAQAANAAHPDEPELWPSFSVQLTFADGTVQELHMLPLGDADACDLFLGDGLVYVIYTSLATQQSVNTQGFEQGLLDALAAAAAAPAPQTPAPQYQPQPQQEQPAEQDDACVEDGLVY